MQRKIPPFQLTAKPLSPEAEAAAGFEWAADEVGKRHKLGGEPDGAGAAEFPRCSGREEPMTFYGQLDSIGDDICLADAGVVHVFVCFDCFDAAARVASP